MDIDRLQIHFLSLTKFAAVAHWAQWVSINILPSQPNKFMEKASVTTQLREVEVRELKPKYEGQVIYEGQESTYSGSEGL